MNLPEIFCSNPDCPAKGRQGAGNISIHSQAEQRCCCKVGEMTFSVKKGPLFYRLKTDLVPVMGMISLLVSGCPVQAIVVAFGCESGRKKKLDLGQVQADEIKVKIQDGQLWLAMAVMVWTRLWLGGVISRRRDKGLIQSMANKVRGMALCQPCGSLSMACPAMSKPFGGLSAANCRDMVSRDELNGAPGLNWPSCM